MWLRHFFNLLASTAAIFFSGIGTTLLGRVLDTAFIVIVTGISLHGIRKKGGLAAMKEYWDEQLKQTLRVSLVAAIVIYIPVILWSFGKAVYDDHQGLVHRSRDQRAIITTNAVTLQNTKGELGQELATCGTEKAGIEGANGVLASQNRDQQNTINNCQTQALKLLTPPVFEMTAITLSDAGKDDTSRKMEVLILTNLPVTPVKLSGACDRVLKSISAGVLGGAGTMGGGSDVQPPNLFYVAIDFPAWTTKSPLKLDLAYSGKAGMQCRFVKR